MFGERLLVLFPAFQARSNIWSQHWKLQGEKIVGRKTVMLPTLTAYCSAITQPFPIVFTVLLGVVLCVHQPQSPNTLLRPRPSRHKLSAFRAGHAQLPLRYSCPPSACQAHPSKTIVSAFRAGQAQLFLQYSCPPSAWQAQRLHHSCVCLPPRQAQRLRHPRVILRMPRATPRA